MIAPFETGAADQPARPAKVEPDDVPKLVAAY